MKTARFSPLRSTRWFGCTARSNHAALSSGSTPFPCTTISDGSASCGRGEAWSAAAVSPISQATRSAPLSPAAPTSGGREPRARRRRSSHGRRERRSGPRTASEERARGEARYPRARSRSWSARSRPAEASHEVARRRRLRTVAVDAAGTRARSGRSPIALRLKTSIIRQRCLAGARVRSLRRWSERVRGCLRAPLPRPYRTSVGEARPPRPG
jgi:hypothetical protein